MCFKIIKGFLLRLLAKEVKPSENYATPFSILGVAYSNEISLADNNLKEGRILNVGWD